ncbi:hypothetical protein HFP72_14745 [Nocardiopsis sp. ARC36]
MGMVEGDVGLDGVSARNTRRLRIARAITVWSTYPLALAQAFWAVIDAGYLSDVGLPRGSPPWRLSRRWARASCSSSSSGDASTARAPPTAAWSSGRSS